VALAVCCAAFASTSEDRFAVDYAEAEQDAKFNGVFGLTTPAPAAH
jgi:hypothetical protein